MLIQVLEIKKSKSRLMPSVSSDPLIKLAMSLQWSTCISLTTAEPKQTRSTTRSQASSQ